MVATRKQQYKTFKRRRRSRPIDSFGNANAKYERARKWNQAELSENESETEPDPNCLAEAVLYEMRRGE